MGHRNWQLLNKYEAARKAGRTEEADLLALQVVETQDACPHSDKDLLVVPTPVEMHTRERGVIKAGDTIVQCQACSFVVRHYPKS